MHSFANQFKLAAVALTLASTGASAQTLQRFDMAKLPLAEFNLQGGSFIAQLFEASYPYRSQLLIECQDCTTTNDALVGLVAAEANEVADFTANPDRYVRQVKAVCLTQAQNCAFEKASRDGLNGYAYVAQYEDGVIAVEHTYFSNGLLFVINAVSMSEDISRANVETLIDVASPYVTGKKK